MITAAVATNRTRLRLSASRDSGSGKLGQQAQKAKMLETCGTTNSNVPPRPTINFLRLPAEFPEPESREALRR
jgi:hypothetical protein